MVAQWKRERCELDGVHLRVYLDTPGSVSGSPQLQLTLNDADLDDQYRRFLNAVTA